jgi:hypothetical protein
MLSNQNYPQVNPELFKGEAPSELSGETYYAYLDSVEQNEGKFFIRLDCVLKEIADKRSMSLENINELPSIIIEITGDSQLIRNRFNNNLYSFESNWLVFTTKIQNTQLNIQQFFNFSRVGNQEDNNNYDLESVLFPKNLDSASKAKIKELIRLTTLKESEPKEVNDFASRLPVNDFQYVNVYNVGQGNCTALVNSSNLPLVYFDVGGGKSDFPTNFKLCTTDQPPVILSHWDLDHIQTAAYDTRILDSKWLVPVQSSLSLTASKIAYELIRRRNLICWNNSIQAPLNFAGHQIIKCNGLPHNKNNSGLALIINYGNKEFVLLPGDATFKKIPFNNKLNLIGLIASHHGSRGAISGMPMGKLPKMLVYSYGQNTNGHPNQSAVKSYANHRWGKGLETRYGSIAMTTVSPSFNPACGGRRCSLFVVQHF